MAAKTAGRRERFRVVLTAPGERMRLVNVIKAIRTHTELRELREAKAAYFETPRVLIETVDYDDAAVVHDAVKRAGGLVRLETVASCQVSGTAS